VAIVVGGVGLGEITVELYSPDDKCNIILNPINASKIFQAGFQPEFDESNKFLPLRWSG